MSSIPRRAFVITARTLCLLALACLAAPTSTRANDFAGAWITEATAYAPLQQLLVFRSDNGTDDGRWSGTMTTRFGTMTLENIAFQDGQLSFSQVFDLGLGPVSPVRGYGELRGDKLHLNILSATDGYLPRVARRATAQEVAQINAATPKTRRWRPLPHNGLARTPPMGWNSFNHFGIKIDDKTVREVADAMVESGLRDAGYLYVVIDDGWQGQRDKNGVLQPTPNFPDMKALADYVHGRGLKFGLYSGPGPLSCGGHLTSYEHEEQDAKTFAAWGVDYLKYDWCDATYMHNTPAEMQAAFWKMGAALQASGRPIVYALCQYGLFDVGQWGRNVGGNLWRTTYDISDYWSRMLELARAQIGKQGNSRPGGWNDPDMLEVGNHGMTLDESRAHMTLWSMLSAPLLLGNDVRNMTPEIKAMLTNKDVIAVNQDALGVQAQPLRGTEEIWTKPLADGSVAIAIVNLDDEPQFKRVPWSISGLPKVVSARELWSGTDLTPGPDGYSATIPAHGAVMLRVSGKRPPAEKPLSVVFIGDSITHGVTSGEAPPVHTMRFLSKQSGVSRAAYSNQGHGGFTTVNFLPSWGKTFAAIEAAADKLQRENGGDLVFSIMLGTNDSAMDGPLGSPVSPELYGRNLNAIVSQLLNEYPTSRVVIHKPIWYSSNTYNSSRYLEDGLNRLQTYFARIDGIVAGYGWQPPRRVFAGDAKMFDLFKNDHEKYMLAEQGQQGTFYLHPNDEGAEVLGRHWGEAIYEAVRGPRAEEPAK